MRKGMLLAAALLGASPPARLPAQDSQFGIAGLGTPERGESVRARATAGAFGLFDPLSPMADAAVVALQRLTASASGATSYRTVELGDESADLRTTRFPALTVGGPVFGRARAAGGFTAYLGRSYRIETRDSVVLRGELEPYTDEIASDGGVTDLRVAAAFHLTSRLAIGGSLHLLTGSTRATATRRFDDSLNYQPAVYVDELRYEGLGGSASFLLDVGRGLQVAAYLRSDTRLEYHGSGTSGAYDLPISVGGGALWRPSDRVALAAAAHQRTWSAAGLNAHDTFEWSVGAEIGRPSLPFRLGVRRGRVPFGPGAEAPTELGIAAGLGFRFSGGRGIVDVGVERLERDGGGLTERVWTALVGITVRP